MLPQGVLTPSNPDDFVERFEYDERGRQVLHVSFEGIYTTFEYDAATGRLKAKRFFDNESDYNAGTPSQVWLYAYDAFGRQTKVERRDGAGATLRLEETTYDQQGRVLRESSPEGAVNYEYDALGRRVRTYTGTTADPVNDTLYTYDELGRLETVTAIERNNQAVDSDEITPGDQPAETRYEYDLIGNLDEEYKANGVVSDYEYDNLNRLTSLTHENANGDEIASFEYTVRADGKRTGETYGFDEDGDGIIEAAEQGTTTWDYDNLGRLTDETFSDPEFVDSLYTYDLAGNRTKVEKDTDGDGVIDESTNSTYDANDRLLKEEVENDGDALFDDKVTTYGYDHTQQTSKEVREEDVLKTRTTNTYNLQGRLESVTVESFDTSGNLSSREVTTYQYNTHGVRVSALREVDADGDGVNDTVTNTEYLNNSHNHAGYSQVLQETQRDPATGHIQKRIVYTLGHGKLAQTTITYSAGSSVTRKTLVLTKDGHGSTRVLLDMLGAIATVEGVQQIFQYDAFGNLLNMTAEQAATSILYVGQMFDTGTCWYNNINRWYDARTGRFNRVDPFFGFVQDPQSLHKYLYVHADPVNFVDPSGLWSVRVALGSIGISVNMQSMKAAAGYSARQAGWATLETSLEMMAGKLISVATGIPFDPTPEDVGRTWGTNFASNVLTAGIGGKSNRLRNIIEFAVRTISDVAIGRENIWFAAGLNLVGLTGSAMLAKYGQKLIARSIAPSSGLIRGSTPSRLVFDGMEVRAVRNLSHVDDSTLRAMAKNGFAPKDINGKKLILHHLDQNPAGPVVEMPGFRHSIGNRVQHPLGNSPGVGLTAGERAAFNAWRESYWKARALAELTLRGVTP